MSEKVKLSEKHKKMFKDIGLEYLVKEIESGAYAKRHLTEWPND